MKSLTAMALGVCCLVGVLPACNHGAADAAEPDEPMTPASRYREPHEPAAEPPSEPPPASEPANTEPPPFLEPAPQSRSSAPPAAEGPSPATAPAASQQLIDESGNTVTVP
jgi:hypothetical protein